jgi:hypothetical protein
MPRECFVKLDLVEIAVYGRLTGHPVASFAKQERREPGRVGACESWLAAVPLERIIDT